MTVKIKIYFYGSFYAKILLNEYIVLNNSPIFGELRGNMNSKLINSTLLKVTLSIFVLFSTISANANLITGDIYLDGDGERWEYVTLFDLVGNNNPKGEASPNWRNAKPVNGLEAAAYFLDDNTNNLAISAFLPAFDMTSISAGDNVVNHLAWYDGSIAAVSRLSENVTADVNGDNLYDNTTDVSAWIDDRAFSGDYINYVFKRVTDVPEPSSIAIFSLFLIGLSLRGFKKRLIK